MSEAVWNAWKMTTFGLLLVGSTALVMTLVMNYRADHDDVKQTGAASQGNASVRKASVPSQLEVAECRAYAQERSEDKTVAVNKDAAIGGNGGVGMDAAGGAAARGSLGADNAAAGHDVQYQVAYRSCMRRKGY